jgi:hypothetical protein
MYCLLLKKDIVQKEESAYNTAVNSMRRALSFDGNPATVDGILVTELRRTIATFEKEAVTPGVAPSHSYADKLQLLKDQSLVKWKEAHRMNQKEHQLKRAQLSATAIPAVERRFVEDIDSPGNGRVERVYNLASKAPDYFHPSMRGLLHSVSVSLDCVGGGTFNLPLASDNGKQLVSRKGTEGGKWLSNEVYYDPDSTELSVVLQGGGWNDTELRDHRLWIKSTTLKIAQTRLSLPENEVYNQVYLVNDKPPQF